MHEEDAEVAHLVELYRGDGPQIMARIESQLMILATRAQTLLSLAGITITVTGFSGHNMVRGGHLSTAAMVVGMLCVLGGIVRTLYTLRGLRWVSQELDDDLYITARAVIARRDEEQRALGGAGALVVAGLGAYLLAVVLAAMAVGGAYSPP